LQGGIFGVYGSYCFCICSICHFTGVDTEEGNRAVEKGYRKTKKLISQSLLLGISQRKADEEAEED
jgi:hypothetical protein